MSDACCNLQSQTTFGNTQERVTAMLWTGQIDGCDGIEMLQRVITKSWEIKWKRYWLGAKCKFISLLQSWICVALHCPGRAQCTGNRIW